MFAPSAEQARAAAEQRTTALKIISGGQTGVDRGALDAALALGVDCGGWCPAGRLAEDGPIPLRYPVVELPNGGYADRTARNVTDSDATLIVANGPLTGGTHETVQCCIEMQKPYSVIDCASASIDEGLKRAVEFVSALSSQAQIPVRFGLNVAGPRASQWPQGHDVAEKIVSALLLRLSGHGGSDE